MPLLGIDLPATATRLLFDMVRRKITTYDNHSNGRLVLNDKSNASQTVTDHGTQAARPSKLLAAYSAAWHELSTVTKDRENPHLKVKYATLTATLETLRPVCQKHGIALLQAPGEIVNGNLRIVGVLIHADSGENMTFTTDVPLGDSPTPQKMGSASTYGRRYQVHAIFGLTAADEDDDGERFETRKTPDKGPQRPQGFQKR
jgi:hypothetical protein